MNEVRSWKEQFILQALLHIASFCGTSCNRLKNDDDKESVRISNLDSRSNSSPPAHWKDEKMSTRVVIVIVTIITILLLIVTVCCFCLFRFWKRRKMRNLPPSNSNRVSVNNHQPSQTDVTVVDGIPRLGTERDSVIPPNDEPPRYSTVVPSYSTIVVNANDGLDRGSESVFEVKTLETPPPEYITIAPFK